MTINFLSERDALNEENKQLLEALRECRKLFPTDPEPDCKCEYCVIATKLDAILKGK